MPRRRKRLHVHWTGYFKRYHFIDRYEGGFAVGPISIWWGF